MGSRMARALLTAGYSVTVWNVDHELCKPLLAIGAHSADTPRQAVRGADFVICMVWDDDASRYVWLDSEVGALRGMLPGSVALECATLTIEHEHKLLCACEAAGIEFVSAPMSGSLPEADSRTLVFTVGARDDILERVRPVLMAMGSKINHAGAPLDGISTKLIINGKLAIEYAFAAEMVALMQVAGMDASRRLDICATTAPFSSRGLREARFMLDGNTSVRVKVDQMIKDLQNQILQHEVWDVPCPMLRAALAVFELARANGHGQADSVALVRQHAPRSTGEQSVVAVARSDSRLSLA